MGPMAIGLWRRISVSIHLRYYNPRAMYSERVKQVRFYFARWSQKVLRSPAALYRRPVVLHMALLDKTVLGLIRLGFNFNSLIFCACVSF